jgi:Ice-binding-like
MDLFMVRMQVFRGGFRGTGLIVAVGMLLGLLCGIVPWEQALAETAPTLGTAQSYAVLGASTVTNTGPSLITGDLGVSPGTAVTGFPPGLVAGGSIHPADAVALQAQTDATTAYGQLAGQACNTTYGVPTDLGGQTLVPGVYCFSSSAAITGALTLNAGGNPNAVFIFKVASTLVTASDASVVLINGAQPCEVFWQVGSSATLGTGTSFVGTVIALASITLDTNATMTGRALARNGAVTLDSNTVSVTSCSLPINSPPVLGESFSPSSIVAGGDSTLTITISNPSDTASTVTSPFAESLPSGLVFSGSAVSSGGGTISAPIGGSALSWTGASFPPNSTTNLTVEVSAANAGSYINSLPSGVLQTSTGNNVSPVIATLTVTSLTSPTLVAPTLGKAFNPANIALGGVSTLVLTLNNSNPVIDTMTAPLTDHFPSGLKVAGNPTTTCGGTVDALLGSSAVTLTGGIIPANGSCTVSVNVAADCGCTYYNSVSVGALLTDNGSNPALAAATLTVTKAAPGGLPKVSKYFYPDEVKPGVPTTLTITLTNPNATVATLTAPFTDHLPSGMVLTGVPTTAPGNTCGGALSASKGSGEVILTGGQIPINGSCIINVRVVAEKAGAYVNSLPVGVLKTSNGSNPTGWKATLTVSPSAGNGTQLLKSFSPSTIANDGVSTLTIILKNPYSAAATLTAPLIDHMPARMVVYGAASNTCGGVVTASPGSSEVTLTGGAIPAKGSCQVTVSVTAPCNVYFNGLPAGALHTSNGTNQEPAGATLTVLPITM